ncbi:MAG: hypothetical protein V4750_19370, partial [Pseudomonadota bacterium]
IERSVDDHGAIAPPALLQELRDRAVAVDGASAVLDRITAFHDPEPQTDLQQELVFVLGKLRLKSVEEELELLVKSGVQSPDTLTRHAELMRLQRQLKVGVTV